MVLCKTSISIQSTYVQVQDKNMPKKKKKYSITAVINMYNTGTENVYIK